MEINKCILTMQRVYIDNVNYSYSFEINNTVREEEKQIIASRPILIFTENRERSELTSRNCDPV